MTSIGRNQWLPAGLLVIVLLTASAAVGRAASAAEIVNATAAARSASVRMRVPAFPVPPRYHKPQSLHTIGDNAPVIHHRNNDKVLLGNDTQVGAPPIEIKQQLGFPRRFDPV